MLPQYSQFNIQSQMMSQLEKSEKIDVETTVDIKQISKRIKIQRSYIIEPFSDLRLIWDINCIFQSLNITCFDLDQDNHIYVPCYYEKFPLNVNTNNNGGMQLKKNNVHFTGGLYSSSIKEIYNQINYEALQQNEMNLRIRDMKQQYQFIMQNQDQIALYETVRMSQTDIPWNNIQYYKVISGNLKIYPNIDYSSQKGFLSIGEMNYNRIKERLTKIFTINGVNYTQLSSYKSLGLLNSQICTSKTPTTTIGLYYSPFVLDEDYKIKGNQNIENLYNLKVLKYQGEYDIDYEQNEEYKNWTNPLDAITLLSTKQSHPGKLKYIITEGFPRNALFNFNYKVKIVETIEIDIIPIPNQKHLFNL